MSDGSEAAKPERPWIAAQRQSLLQQRGHAWLLQGPSGLGQYSLALSLVRAWLCERPHAEGACGDCPSCHAVDVRTHADLCVLMPETKMLELGWPLGEKAQSEIDDKKRKASKEIRVDAMRDAVEFVQRTSSRGQGKAILVFPAEQMNAITANALLKTLEEPPGNVRFVLATESAHQLLPTIRSRCISHAMRWPTSTESIAWLQSMGLAPDLAAASLKSAGGRPDDALDFIQSGRDPAVWKHLRVALARGDVGIFKDWTSAQQLDALQKLCHDLMAQHVHTEPRFIAAEFLGSRVPLRRLCAWQKDLFTALKTCEHPFNAGLMTEALVSQARIALNSKHREN
ncbi:MAG: DNA polymerase III subunit delta' [Burkholderiales bacterium PBB4]|nr:MAG: DNA polymerase III subunit delta' [Burkholderiales bacterium PBB4]